MNNLMHTPDHAAATIGGGSGDISREQEIRMAAQILRESSSADGLRSQSAGLTGSWRGVRGWAAGRLSAIAQRLILAAGYLAPRSTDTPARVLARRYHIPLSAARELIATEGNPLPVTGVGQSLTSGPVAGMNLELTWYDLVGIQGRMEQEIKEYQWLAQANTRVTDLALSVRLIVADMPRLLAHAKRTLTADGKPD